MTRVGGLYYYMAGLVAPSGTTAHLFQHIKCTLGGSKIRVIDDCIGIEYHRCTDITKIQSFSNHLRTHKNICLVPGKSIDNVGIIILVTRCVQVHT